MAACAIPGRCRDVDPGRQRRKVWKDDIVGVTVKAGETPVPSQQLRSAKLFNHAQAWHMHCI